MSAVISVENVTKAYRLGMIGGATLKEDFARWWAKVRRKPDPLLKIGQEHHARRMGEQFWALDGVSFQVKEGEVLGIIGRNGAGKSTLLKILSQVTAPTSGEIKIKGRIASLLEVGTGFHPELTGRENIFLNGAILGMTKAEIRRKLDEIIDFSGIEQFVDTPVKRYSSGMYVRLAFAVAAHLEPEILVVDEVLAVGDAEFQQKCLGKMQEVSRGGRTVIFVSHQLDSVRQLCQRALLLVEGSLALDDVPSVVIENYLHQGPDGIEGGCFLRKVTRPAGNVFFVQKVLLTGEGSDVTRAYFGADENVIIHVFYHATRAVSGLYGYIIIQRTDGVVVYEGDSFDMTPDPFGGMQPGDGQMVITLPGRLLASGKYLLGISFASNEDPAGFMMDDPGIVGQFQLTDNITRRGSRRQGYLSTRLNWRTLDVLGDKSLCPL